jgi:predicted SAM-dependent methyltransferase
MKKLTLNRYKNTPIYILIGKSVRKIYETLIESFTVPELKEPFRHLPFSGHAIQKLIADYNFTSKYDAVWCSHVLEHQPNPNIFLTKIYSLLNDSGDIRKIKKCLPDLKFFETQNDNPFNGNIYKINW